VDERALAIQLRRIASRCLCEPNDVIARELRALADALYPPIRVGKAVTRFTDGRRVTVKTQPRQNFRIYVGK
jgi:hypothetical protein